MWKLQFDKIYRSEFIWKFSFHECVTQVSRGIKKAKKKKRVLTSGNLIEFLSRNSLFNFSGSVMLRAHFLGSHGQFVRPRGKHHRFARRALLVLELIQGACPVGPRRRWSSLRNGKCQWRCYRRPLHRRPESKWMKFLVGAEKEMREADVGSRSYC